MTVFVSLLAGLLITIAAIAARGTDLRSDRNLSLRELIVEQGQRNTQLRNQVDQARAEVDALSSQDQSLLGLQRDQQTAEEQASAYPVSGPSVRVVLTDAPNDVKPAGADDDDLVVHQQDIQAVVNALWAGGAEAMTIQGERVISTTGIKCVGNTVVLRGVPYAPPYIIEAIGDQDRLEEALEDSHAIQIYRQYVEAYGLGYDVSRISSVDMPGFSGSTGINLARQP